MRDQILLEMLLGNALANTHRINKSPSLRDFACDVVADYYATLSARKRRALVRAARELFG